MSAVAGKPVTAVALNASYDHAGGWADFAERACHPLDAPDLETPDVEDASAGDYLNDETLWSLPRVGYDVASKTPGLTASQRIAGMNALSWRVLPSPLSPNVPMTGANAREPRGIPTPLA